MLSIDRNARKKERHSARREQGEQHQWRVCGGERGRRSAVWHMQYIIKHATERRGSGAQDMCAQKEQRDTGARESEKDNSRVLPCTQNKVQLATQRQIVGARERERQRETAREREAEEQARQQQERERRRRGRADELIWPTGLCSTCQTCQRVMVDRAPARSTSGIASRPPSCHRDSIVMCGATRLCIMQRPTATQPRASC